KIPSPNKDERISPSAVPPCFSAGYGKALGCVNGHFRPGLLMHTALQPGDSRGTFDKLLPADSQPMICILCCKGTYLLNPVIVVGDSIAGANLDRQCPRIAQLYGTFCDGSILRIRSASISIATVLNPPSGMMISA